MVEVYAVDDQVLLGNCWPWWLSRISIDCPAAFVDPGPSKDRVVKRSLAGWNWTAVKVVASTLREGRVDPGGGKSSSGPDRAPPDLPATPSIETGSHLDARPDDG